MKPISILKMTNIEMELFSGVTTGNSGHIPLNYEISTQNHWVFGLFPSSGTLDIRKHSVAEIGSVSALRCWRSSF
jgi:hypothetical protein